MKPTRLMLPFALIAAVSVLLCSQAAVAGPYGMSVILDRAHGDLVQRGDYLDAIQRITHGSRQLPFAANNNLCVAQTKLNDFGQAELSCDIAVQLAEFAAEHGHRPDLDYVTELAVALSNRGVLRAMTGDLAGAEDDFRKAAGLNPETDTPAQNLSHLLNGKTAELANY